MSISKEGTTKTCLSTSYYTKAEVSNSFDPAGRIALKWRTAGRIALKWQAAGRMMAIMKKLWKLHMQTPVNLNIQNHNENKYWGKKKQK